MSSSSIKSKMFCSVLLNFSFTSLDEENVFGCWLAVEEARNAYLEQWIDSLNRIDEDGLDEQRIKDAMARIDYLKKESERQRALIKAMRERLKRKRDLEKLRKVRKSQKS
jgi:hypothetical protein